MRQKTCKNCKEKFQPERQLQSACSIKCSIELVNTRKASKERKELKEAKEKNKSRQDLIKEVQIVFNKWRKDSELAKGEGCISCGTHNGKMNCGHYRSVGSSPELRFSETNTWLQCEKCNSYLSGNLINYRINLVKKIGIELVEWLEGAHEPKKYTIEELKEKKEIYKKRLKELKNG